MDVIGLVWYNTVKQLIFLQARLVMWKEVESSIETYLEIDLVICKNR